MTDEAGVSAEATIEVPKGSGPERRSGALLTLRENLGKLGNTLYIADEIELAVTRPWFIPASTVNALRRDVVDALDRARLAACQRPTRRVPVDPPATYPDDALSYLGNVYNEKARAFYEKHGVKVIEPAFECHQEKGDVSLMITKHCLRFSFNLCPKQVKGIRPDPMILMKRQREADAALRLQAMRDARHRQAEKAANNPAFGAMTRQITRRLSSAAESRRAGCALRPVRSPIAFACRAVATGPCRRSSCSCWRKTVRLSSSTRCSVRLSLISSSGQAVVHRFGHGLFSGKYQGLEQRIERSRIRPRSWPTIP